jgi:PIN domain nuclease of toxin-antitoxin system
MRLLLDTHTWLWAISDPSNLTARTRKLLTDPATEVYLSVASVWEMAIKISLGKLELKGADQLDGFVTRINADAGVQSLAIHISDVAAVRDLPWHHRDPFDRLLVAQARRNELALVSRDTALKAHGIKVIW